MIKIDTIEEFELCVNRGFQPLLDNRFKVDIKLRVDLQYRYFCNSSNRKRIPEANFFYYKTVWNLKSHICEECKKPLHNYSASFISHILSKGAFPEISLDLRNNNILCYECHNKWEFGEKETMDIYPKNSETIELLKYEYNIERNNKN